MSKVSFKLAGPYWKAPFHYDEMGSMVLDANNAMIIDVRGWGHLTGTGSHGLKDEEAARIQDQTGNSLAALLNKHWSD